VGHGSAAWGSREGPKGGLREPQGGPGVRGTYRVPGKALKGVKRLTRSGSRMGG
jgi:hypothetical protein